MKNGSCAIKEIKVGSRPSPLAKIQVQEIIGLFPAIDFQIQYTDSMGDKDRTKDLMSEGIPQDFFTREIDQLILRDMVDIGVHSAKDLPEVLPRGLEIFAITQGKNPGDSLVGPAGYNLDSLPQSAKVGTSSLRRKTQLLKIRPDLEILPIRGNIHERIQLTRDNLADAVVVATCALERLGLDSGVSLPLITHPLQGFLAVVGREEEQHLKDIFSPMDVRKSWGSVGLVGAGPGDPSLMTIQGRKVLEEADEVFYDALLDPRQLRGLKASLKYVGKRKGEHSYAQERIQDFMIRSAQAGRQVVRLKGGDPFVFGRGGEEVLALREARLNYRVVPGVSSALGAAAYLDLPLTQRNVSSSLAFSMGYPPEEIRVLNVDSQAVFMGRSNIGLFAQQALAKGYGPQTSLVLVENATWPQQRRIELSLEAALNYRHDSSEPVLVILSRSSEVFTGPSWFERQRKVLYTGTDPEKYNGPGLVVHYPVIELSAWAVSEFDLGRVQDYNWLIFTSKYGVDYFFDAWFSWGKDTRDLSDQKIFSIGPVTTDYLRMRGLLPNREATVSSSPGVVQEFIKMNLAPAKVLIPSSELALPIIPQGLRQLGHTVDRLNVYGSDIPANRPEIKLESFDSVVFSSPSCVDNFFELFDTVPVGLEFETKGPTTAGRLAEVLEK